MRLIPSSPLSCLGTAAVAAVIGGFVLVGCDVVEFDEFDTDFTLFSGSGEASPSPEASAEPSPGEEEEEEQEETAQYALPESCAEAGAAEVVGDLAPGAVLAEERGEVEGFADAEQLTCSFSDGTAGASAVTLVFTLNVDPSLSPDVVTVPGAEEEMNWEVDIDVDVDTYHTDEADSLGGDLEYVGTVDGSTRHLYLSLPGDLYVTVIAHGEEVPREDLERVVMLAAERVRG